MQETGFRNSAHGADKFGFKDLAAVHWNLDAPQLYEHAIAAGELNWAAPGMSVGEESFDLGAYGGLS